MKNIFTKKPYKNALYTLLCVVIEFQLKYEMFDNRNNLKKGDKLRIPRYKTVKPKQTLSNTVKKYTVQAKEGKWRIAYKFGISVADLEALNPSMKETIQPGDELNVPNIHNQEEKVIEDNLITILRQTGLHYKATELITERISIEKIVKEKMDSIIGEYGFAMNLVMLKQILEKVQRQKR